MRFMLFRLIVYFCTLLGLLSTGKVRPCAADTTVSSAITTDTTWTLAGSPYIVTASFEVYGTDGADGITTLTIEAGVEVRFNLGRNFYVGMHGPGALIVQGTAADPVVFTSNRASPAPGDWQGIWIYSYADDTTTRLEHCEFRYAGSSIAAVYIYGSAPSLQNCTFISSGKYDIKYLGAVGGSVTDCNISNGILLLGTGQIDFTGNAISYNNSFPIITKPENVHNLLNGNTINNVDADSYLEVRSGTIAQDALWPAMVPLHILGSLTVQGTDGPDGVTTLTLGPGLQMKFAPPAGSLNVGAASGAPGALAVQGTVENSVVFTSLAESPAPGDWYGIRIYNTADDTLTKLENCLIDFAGYYYNAAVLIKDSAPTLINCNINNCANYDLDYSGTVGGSVSGCTINNGIKLETDSTVYFTNNTINYNNDRPIIAKANNIHQLANGNTYNNLDAGSYLQVNSGTISADAVWTDAIPFFITSGSLTVQGTDGADGVTTLTIEPGARLKFGTGFALKIGAASGDPGALIAQGTSENMVLFTTNQPNPGPGAWDNIHFYPTAAENSLIDYCVVEYGGLYGKGGVYLDNASVTVSNSIIRNNYTYGLTAGGTGSNTADIQCNTFENNGTGILAFSGALPAVHYNNFINNASFGISSGTAGMDAENNWWNDIAGPNQGGDKTYGSIDTEPWSTELNQCVAASENHAPLEPASPTPADNAVNVFSALPITLIWAGADPDPDDALEYDVYLGQTEESMNLEAQHLSAASYVISEPIPGVTYFWQVTARDSQGLETNGPVWRFTSKGDRPDLIVAAVVTNPAGNLQNGQNTTLTATVLNNGTGPVVDSFVVDFKVAGSSIGTPEISEIMLAGQSVLLSLPWTYDGGDPTIDILADSQGTVAETDNQNNRFTALVSEVADMTAPVLTGTDPIDGAYLQQVNQILITLTDAQSALEDTAVIESIAVSDSSQQSVAGTTVESNDNFTFTPLSAPLSDGDYTVALTAIDIHGNAQNYSFSFTVDSQPPNKPAITGSTVASGTIQARPAQNNSNQFIVELTGTRDVSTSVWLNGVERVAMGSSPWSIQLTLQPGENPLELWLEDRAGNQGMSEWVDISVSTTGTTYFDYDASGRVSRIDAEP